MIALIHGAVGAACGSFIRRPGATVAAALISHFLLDAFRHEEPFDENERLRVDLIALDGLLLGLALMFVGRRYGLLSPQALGALAGPLPDGEHLIFRPRSMKRSKIHKHFPHAVWPARAVNLRRQFLIGAVAWLALLTLPTRFRNGDRTNRRSCDKPSPTLSGSASP